MSTGSHACARRRTSSSARTLWGRSLSSARLTTASTLWTSGTSPGYWLTPHPAQPGSLRVHLRAAQRPARRRSGTKCSFGSSADARPDGSHPLRGICMQACSPPAAEIASPLEGSNGDKGMGSFEEEGELSAGARARGAVRSLRVHVPTACAWRLQVGQGAHPGVRHVRRVHPSARLRGLRGRSRRRTIRRLFASPAWIVRYAL